MQINKKTLTRWLEAYETFAPTLNLYFAATTGAHKFVDGRFLSLAHALETYHRRTSTETFMPEEEYSRLALLLSFLCPKHYYRWLERALRYGNEIGLQRRLKQLLNSLGDRIGDEGARKVLAHQIADTRNYLTHYSDELKERAVRGAELGYLCSKMEATLQLLFLRELQFSDDDVARILQRSSLPAKLQPKRGV